jgi:hypothetical protein
LKQNKTIYYYYYYYYYSNKIIIIIIIIIVITGDSTGAIIADIICILADELFPYLNNKYPDLGERTAQLMQYVEKESNCCKKNRSSLLLLLFLIFTEGEERKGKTPTNLG